MSELKPCPFCGEKAQIREHWGPRDPWYEVECQACPVSMFGVTEEEAIKAWNRRADGFNRKEITK